MKSIVRPCSLVAGGATVKKEAICEQKIFFFVIARYFTTIYRYVSTD